MELTPTPKTRQKNKSNRVLELIGGVGADAKNIASRSLGDLYLVMKDLFGFNVTQYFKAIFLERSWLTVGFIFSSRSSVCMNAGAQNFEFF